MIKQVVRQGLVKYEREEADIRQDAAIELAKIELEEKDAEKKTARISAVLQTVENALQAFPTGSLHDGHG